jgi:hypothetical protein
MDATPMRGLLKPYQFIRDSSQGPNPKAIRQLDETLANPYSRHGLKERILS